MIFSEKRHHSVRYQQLLCYHLSWFAPITPIFPCTGIWLIRFVIKKAAKYHNSDI